MPNHTLAISSLPTSTVDTILTAQITVGWAGETGDGSGDDSRLGWWRSDLVSEFGGEDLFQRLLPQTWQWAVLQSVREAAIRHDAALRAKDHNPDRLLSLFNLGFALDECVAERLQELKQTHHTPTKALPGLAELLLPEWSLSNFTLWLETHTTTTYATVPVGRRMKHAPPSSPETMVSQLIAALLPLSDGYSLPHFKRTL